VFCYDEIKMLTPTHGFFDTVIYFILTYFDIIKFRYFDLILLYSAGLIDLDHLFSKPIFDPKRNPFKELKDSNHDQPSKY